MHEGRVLVPLPRLGGDRIPGLVLAHLPAQTAGTDGGSVRDLLEETGMKNVWIVMAVFMGIGLMVWVLEVTGLADAIYAAGWPQIARSEWTPDQRYAIYSTQTVAQDGGYLWRKR